MRVELNIKTTREVADWGTGSQPAGPVEDYYVSVSVEPDGEVLQFDTVSETYTRCHSLPDSVVSEARRLAAQVRAGTHYTAGGFVFERRSEPTADPWVPLHDR